MRVKTACDRDDVSFICVAATVRALTAGRIISMAAERVFQDPGSRRLTCFPLTWVQLARIVSIEYHEFSASSLRD
jgi:hypothetical protein